MTHSSKLTKGIPLNPNNFILCGLSLLTSDPSIADRATDASWDLAVVDEAHHLTWSPLESKRRVPSDRTTICRMSGTLVANSNTRTTWRGKPFARLRLLDASRFDDLDKFVAEQSEYVALNSTVQSLTTGKILTAEQQSLLNNFSDIDPTSASPEELVNQLLDQHGTGRVLFRNTRAAIAGFPRRLVYPYPLTPESSAAIPPFIGNQLKPSSETAALIGCCTRSTRWLVRAVFGGT